MKKAFYMALIAAAAAGCNSSGNGSSSSDTSHTNTQSVENVNGNMPDTSNSVPITGRGNRKDTDSTYIDTAKRKPR